jgi:hypothetical protein
MTEWKTSNQQTNLIKYDGVNDNSMSTQAAEAYLDYGDIKISAEYCLFIV